MRFSEGDQKDNRHCRAWGGGMRKGNKQGSTERGRTFSLSRKYLRGERLRDADGFQRSVQSRLNGTEEEAVE